MSKLPPLPKGFQLQPTQAKPSHVPALPEGFELQHSEQPRAVQQPQAQEPAPADDDSGFLDATGNFVRGAAHGVVGIGDGINQLLLEGGAALDLVEDNTVKKYERAVDKAQKAYEASDAGQSLAGKAGEIAGSVGPFLVAPEMGLARAGVGVVGRVAGSVAENTAISAAQYVPEGGSRLDNMKTGAALGLAGPLAATAIRPVGAGIKRIFRGDPAKVAENAEQFKSVGIPITAGQAGEGRFAQGLESTMSSLPGGGKLSETLERQQEGIGERVKTIAEDIAPDASTERAGAAIKSGIKKFSKDFKSTAGRLYDRVDAHIPADKTVSADNTLRALGEVTGGTDDISAGLRSPALRNIHKALIDKHQQLGGASYAEIKGLRSVIGKRLGEPRLMDDIGRADLKHVYGALTDDMKTAAHAAGPEAVKALDRANKYYRSGSQRIDNYLKNINRKITPESVYKAAIGGTKDDAVRLRALKRSVGKEEWNLVAASQLKKLGMKTAGNQDESGEAFSTNTFLTNWNKMHPDVRKELFTGTPKLRKYSKDIDTIAAVTSRLKESSSAFANPSGTGQRMAWITTMLLGPVAMGGAAATAGASRLMTNPRFVRWLAKGISHPKGGNLTRHVTRLATIAATLPKDDRDLIKSYQSELENVMHSDSIPSASMPASAYQSKVNAITRH